MTKTLTQKYISENLHMPQGSYVGKAGDLTFNPLTNILAYHDGVLAGGYPVASAGSRLSINPAPYSATISGGVITENVNGVSVVSTIGSGTISTVYGAPVNQTWVSTISAGSISTVKTVG